MKIVVLLSVIILLYHDILHKLILDWWNDSNYSHGFFVPFLSLFLLWQKRTSLMNLMNNKESSNYGIVLTAVGLAFLIIGRAGAELFLQRISLIIVLAGIVLLFGGGRLFKACFPALAFLIFMIPIPYIVYDAIAFPLRLLSADVATNSLNAMNIPSFREGNIIHTARITLEVSDACSGIRSLVSLFTLGTFMSIIMLKRNLKRCILILCVIPIAILSNATRIISTGVLSYLYGGQYAEGFFHEFSGLFVFVLAVSLLGLVSTLLTFDFKRMHIK